MTVMPKLEDLVDQSFDPFVVEKLSTGDCPDPYPRIHELAARSPVIEGSYRMQFTDVPDAQMGHLPQVMVLGYDAVLHVLTNPEIFRNKEAFAPNLGKSFGNTVTVMDAPEHTRFRKIFQKAFLPQVVAKWGESVVDPVVSRLMENFIHRGEADLIEEFTHHYPFQVIYAQVELDPAQGPTFHKLAIAQLLSSIGLPQGPEASGKLGAFFTELLRQKRANPGPDLISHLANVEADGEKLPDDVLVSFLRQLMNAGGDTTYRGTSVLLTALLTHPDQLAAVIADRSLIPAAIEEALRWEGPVSSTFRYCSVDTEIMGHPIKAGTYINTVLASANRDPEKFPEPDKFDIFRKNTVRNLAFASGPHLCIGQHLARVEMTRALNAILDRMPNLRLDPDKPAPAIIGHLLRVPEHLWVKFDAS
ncbi:cytochrome P450 [Novosphingobium taihuense]|uniref:Cytochrome P450 n=1 Tax=Novosphingobium taihuense TaxID=260085 RepID=A0A7W7AG82_9SPHN|nr:cytochrome P450 [Novosphingobium taihuense]MBB4615447.1 cytochrome P450 [Novosphingobium taihuense]TWH82105.1 cytochrome P450 [Novosphingobium taihuense]